MRDDFDCYVTYSTRTLFPFPLPLPPPSLSPPPPKPTQHSINSPRAKPGKTFPGACIKASTTFTRSLPRRFSQRWLASNLHMCLSRAIPLAGR